MSRPQLEVIAGDPVVPVHKAALDWEIELDIRPTEPGHHAGEVEQAHLMCSRCRQSVTCLSVNLDRGAYVISPMRIVADMVRHIRESHCDGGGNLL